MRRYLRFFFRTPQRFLCTLIGIGFLVCLVDPEMFSRTLEHAVSAVVLALQPVIGPALALTIVLAGLRLILTGGKRK